MWAIGSLSVEMKASISINGLATTQHSDVSGLVESSPEDNLDLSNDKNSQYAITFSTDYWSYEP
jgi:hypothetical protein